MLYFYNMSTESEMDAVFKALASPLRRRLLDDLKAAPRTTGDLCARFADLDRCTVMQHLKVLETSGLIVVRREGRERWNHLDALPIKRVHDRWIEPYARNAVAMLDELKSGLEA